MNRSVYIIIALMFGMLSKGVAVLLMAAPGMANGMEGSRPNILFILVDDLGWADVGYQNPRVTETPRVDRLSKEGVVFSSAYAAAVCTPSRAEILTGRSPASLKLTAHIPGIGFEKYYQSKRKVKSHLWDAKITERLHLDEVTIAEALQGAGYATGFFGKWHLAGAGSKTSAAKDGVINTEWHPQHQGFDVNVGGCAYGMPGGKHPYFSPYSNGEIQDGPEGEYLTERLASETISFMKEHRDERFFAYLSFYTIHSPLNPNPTVAERSSSKYGRMLVCMDDAVGRVLDAVDELGLRDNTLVVFTSDNGGTRVQKPLRGKKGSVYEGGIRVPLIYRWPGNTEQGTVVDVPVAAADFFPTLLEATKVPVPETAKRLDGVSYYPLLIGAGDFPIHPVYQHFPHHRTGKVFSGASTVRLGDWKLMWMHHDDSFLLYNLRKDMAESNNLADAQPERVSEMKKQLFSWLTKVDANRARERSAK